MLGSQYKAAADAGIALWVLPCICPKSTPKFQNAVGTTAQHPEFTLLVKSTLEGKNLAS